ncbi:hypothetical protein [Caballeronia calidae]|nr:hypothetical protein [Caballeronia calidae]
MMDLETEETQLRQADEHLALAERQIQHQELIVQDLEKDGHDTSLALKLLRTMRDTRNVMQSNKACIVASIGRINGIRAR